MTKGEFINQLDEFLRIEYNSEFTDVPQTVYNTEGNPMTISSVKYYPNLGWCADAELWERPAKSQRFYLVSDRHGGIMAI